MTGVLDINPTTASSVDLPGSSGTIPSQFGIRNWGSVPGQMEFAVIQTESTAVDSCFNVSYEYAKAYLVCIAAVSTAECPKITRTDVNISSIVESTRLEQ
mgnify:CR=1 FL=1